MPESTGTGAAGLIPRRGSSLARSFPRILLSGVAVTALLGLGRPAGAQTVTVTGADSPYTQTSDVTTTADIVNGIEITGPNVTATIATGVTVSTSGVGSNGVYANTNSNTVTNSGTVSTTGIWSYGIYTFNGSSNTVVNSGTISTSGSRAYGVHATGGSNTLTNSGTVSTLGVDAYGLYADGNSNTLTNSGTVSTKGSGASGVYAEGGSNTLTNSGTVLTEGGRAYGLYAEDGSNTLTNGGTVSTTGSWSSGIYTVNGSSNTAVNSGTISTSGSSAYGVHADGDFNTLTNSGTVSTLGGNAHGLYARGNSNTLTNGGTISTEGNNAYGVYANSGSNTVINSGAITASGSGSYAIRFLGTGNSLTLLTGSRLSGAAGEIYLGSGTAVTIDIDSGPSFAWSYTGTKSSFTNTGSIPVADTGSSFVGITPSDIARSSQTTAHHNLAIAGMLDRVSQQQVRPVRVAGLAEVQIPAPPEWTAWSMAYGERVNGRDSADAAYSTTLHGLAAGMDRHVADSDLTVGGFVGGDLSRTHLDASTHRVRGRNVYLGIRAGEDTGEGLFWNAAGFAGHGGIRSERKVSGGTTTLRADTDALFGGTSGTLGLHTPVAAHLGVTLRGRATYGVQHTDGYDEDISGAKLTVDDRWSQNVSGRLEVSLDRFAADGGWQLSPRLGVERWRTIGDTSTAISFGGQPYTVSDDRADGTGVVFGLDASLNLDEGVTVSAMTEARLEENDTTTIRGFVQIEAPF